MGLEAHDRLGIYLANCMHWDITDFACHAYNLVSVTLYETYGEDAIDWCIQLTQLAHIVTTAQRALTLVQRARAKARSACGARRARAASSRMHPRADGRAGRFRRSSTSSWWTPSVPSCATRPPVPACK